MMVNSELTKIPEDATHPPVQWKPLVVTEREKDQILFTSEEGEWTITSRKVDRVFPKHWQDSLSSPLSDLADLFTAILILSGFFRGADYSPGCGAYLTLYHGCSPVKTKEIKFSGDANQDARTIRGIIADLIQIKVNQVKEYEDRQEEARLEREKKIACCKQYQEVIEKVKD